MRLRILSNIIFGATVVALIGCGNKLSGHYEGVQPVRPETPEHVANTIGKIDLTLNGDGTFVFIRLSMPLEGTWRSDGDRVILQIKSALDKPVTEEPDVVLTKTENGFVFTDTFSSQPILMNKSETKASSKP